VLTIGRGKTIWGSEDDKNALKSDLSMVRGNFTDVPLLIGEYDPSLSPNDPAARWKYGDFIVREAASLGTSVMLWDFGDNALAWPDPVAINIIQNAARGVPNSLPDSTVDTSATEQSTSAFIFHKVGDTVIDYELPFIFNNNVITSITADESAPLVQGTDFTFSEASITFTSSFLSEFISPTAESGIKATLTLNFSTGASVTIQIVQWDIPVLSSSTSQAVAGADLSIPINYKGLQQVAAVEIVLSDGTPLVDTWTVFLPPLQQARSVRTSCL
jgi:endoglucanase